MSTLTNPAFWVAIAGVIGAITALITAVKANTKANLANQASQTAKYTIQKHIDVPTSIDYGHPKQ